MRGTIEWVILNCLQQNPSKRPASAAELRQRLEAHESFGRWTAKGARGWWAGRQRGVARVRRAGTPGVPRNSG